MLNRSRFLRGRRRKEEEEQEEAPAPVPKPTKQKQQETKKQEQSPLTHNNNNNNSMQMDGFSLDGQSLQPSPSPVVPPLSSTTAFMPKHHQKYAQTIDIDSDGDDVSSMNDSIYFGGGASVTGGYSSPQRNNNNNNNNHSLTLNNNNVSPIQKLAHTTTRVGNSPENPISVLQPPDDDMDDPDLSDIFTVNTGLPSNAMFVAQSSKEPSTTVPDTERQYAVTLQELKADMEAALSPTTGILSHSFDDNDDNDNRSQDNSKNRLDKAAGGGGCCGCLSRAPLWLKAVFVFSVLLLLSAIALVGVGFGLGLDTTSDDASSTLDRDFANGFFPTTITAAPAAAVVATLAPSATVVGKDPEATITESPTTAPTKSPSTSIPTASPQEPVTSPPIPENRTVLYFTAGHYPDYLLEQAPDLLAALPGTPDNAFLVHLGDWNDSRQLQCDKNSYKQVSRLFEQSAVPVYFLLGDNEYNDCRDPESALDNWRSELVEFEVEHWDRPPWEIFRQGDSSAAYEEFTENFMFHHQNAVFLSLSVVGGFEYDPVAFARRREANLAWVDTGYDFFSEQAQTMYIFGHDAPPGADHNVQFFEQLFRKIKDYKDMEFVYIHRATSNWGVTEEYNKIKNLDVISVVGPIWPPLRLTIEDGRPIEIDDNWFYDQSDEP